MDSKTSSTTFIWFITDFVSSYSEYSGSFSEYCASNNNHRDVRLNDLIQNYIKSKRKLESDLLLKFPDEVMKYWNNKIHKFPKDNFTELRPTSEELYFVFYRSVLSASPECATALAAWTEKYEKIRAVDGLLVSFITVAFHHITFDSPMNKDFAAHYKATVRDIGFVQVANKYYEELESLMETHCSLSNLLLER